VKVTLYVAAMLLLPAGARAALPGDSAEGKRLHDAYCTSCHDTAVYTRKDHVVRSLAALKEQLEGCSHMAKKEFTPAQTQDLIKYLNDRFYRF
jgi:hypothetical protein